MSLLPMDPSYSAALLEVHWAAQLPAAVSHLLQAKADYSHTNLLVEGERLCGRPLPDGRRAALDVATLTLSLGDESLALAGRTLDDGLRWLSERLGAPIAALEHELPARPLDKPFAISGAENQIQAWFSLAQSQLELIAQAQGGGEVRLWPHHFDIATLIELDEAGGDAEQARSVNVGLSPGDGSYAEPYWYVTPWPRPAGGLPDLTVGHWHREGFLAAVLSASELAGANVEAQVAGFLSESAQACRVLLKA